MKTLRQLYKEWREIANQFYEEEGEKAYDCGEETARLDFSSYVGFQVSFNEMYDLEQEYELDYKKEV